MTSEQTVSRPSRTPIRNARTVERRKKTKRTHLVVDLLAGIGQGDVLLELVADLLELLGLCPVVEGAGNVDLFSGMGPGERRSRSARCLTARARAE